MDWQTAAAREATSPRGLSKNEGLLSTQKRLCFMGVRIAFGCFWLSFSALMWGGVF